MPVDTAVLVAVISGVFSLVSTFGSVWLKHYLEHRRDAIAAATGAAGATRTVSPAAPSTRPMMAPTASEVRSAARGWGVVTPILVLVSGFIVGMVSRWVRQMISGPIHYEALVSIAVLGSVCLLLALKNRGWGRGFWLYQLEVFALWAAFTSGWSLVNAGFWSDLVGFAVACWILSAIVGGLITAIVRRKAGGA